MVLLKISMSRLLQSCRMFKRMTRRSLKMDGTRYYCSINVYIYFLVNPCGTRGCTHHPHDPWLANPRVGGCGYWWVWVRVALGIPKGYPCLSLVGSGSGFWTLVEPVPVLAGWGFLAGSLAGSSQWLQIF